MAKSLQDRLASARETDRTTIETLAKLIEDVRAERDRLTVAHERASGESIDFTLSEDDREEAATNAGRYARTLAALTAALGDLEPKLEAKRNSDAQRAKAAEKAAALTERDEIAAAFADRIPALTGEMIDIFKQVQANAERMRLAGVNEADAEFQARGIPANGYVHNAPASRFTAIKIPDWSGSGRAWPIDYLEEMARKVAADQSELIRRKHEAIERQEREKAEAAAKFAREHGRYRLTVDATGDGERIARIPEELVTRDIPAALGYADLRELVISHEIAKKLAAVPRLKVERLDKKAAQ